MPEYPEYISGINKLFYCIRKVDVAKLKILRRRLSECNVYWGASWREKCEPERKNFEESQIRWYVKCKYKENAINENIYYMCYGSLKKGFKWKINKANNSYNLCMLPEIL